MAACAFICIPIGGCAAQETSKVKSKTTPALLTTIRDARTVLWVGAHCDDEILASGILALASLKFKKDTYTISRTHQVGPVGAGLPPGGTVEKRYRDNEKLKQFLELKDYIRFNPADYPGSGGQDEKFLRFLREFILQKDVDVIISFESVMGFYGHPDHIDVSVQVNRLVEDIASKQNRRITLLYLINGNPDVISGRLSDEQKRVLPYTDRLDMDAESVRMPDGQILSLWNVKYEVLGIYKESVGTAQWYDNRRAWDTKLNHEELYQRAFSSR